VLYLYLRNSAFQIINHVLGVDEITSHAISYHLSDSTQGSQTDTREESVRPCLKYHRILKGNHPVGKFVICPHTKHIA